VEEGFISRIELNRAIVGLYLFILSHFDLSHIGFTYVYFIHIDFSCVDITLSNSALFLVFV